SVFGGSVSEPPRFVVAPTPGDVVGVEGTGVVLASADRPEADLLRSDDFDRRGAKADRPIPELAIGVAAPAPSMSCGIYATGMVGAEIQGDEGDIAVDPNRFEDGISNGSVAQLPTPIEAPAPSVAFGVEGAGVVPTETQLCYGNTGWHIDLDRSGARLI